jgi:hypothetical protein
MDLGIRGLGKLSTTFSYGFAEILLRAATDLKQTDFGSGEQAVR